ncbi:hypothetical protein AOQ84DRAFT_372075 [Glonium stellatum]|uniref:SET domain-containing protein n=1 Tax=Glonium stellatum TaxID=574774 RepID=A0A8E2JY99_9PEZI|nr:hypothetical protein AOQ84DRAFT_372075 [Glonium stellatum]
MTDISSFRTHADPQLSSVAPFGGPSPFAFSNGSPALDGTIDEEESSTIKCICGFPDDDGNTVLCETCDTWQHIVCYYESPQHVPDIHECADCSPRPVDAKRAAEQQRQLRELHNIGERKGKPKSSTKGHKKRVKDAPGAVQTNGWAVHANNDIHYGTERKSGSPRDQPPPAKRPKTGHKPSGSVGIISQTPTVPPSSRKRAGSAMYNGQSPVKSPTTPGSNGYTEDFSPEFIRLCRQPEPALIDSNSYTDIGVANEISTWLDDADALAKATNGMEPAQIFHRVEGSIADLESIAPVITKRVVENTPLWHCLTVETTIPDGAYIGELKGLIGRKADYFQNPYNRWDLLQHPEPFVFFPPHLPIYIDTRREGTMLRYARRSCKPNMLMKILVTENREGGSHFCFVASEEIQPGDELTIGWEISPEIRQLLSNSVTNGDIRKEGFKKVEPLLHWVACVLANFGMCACDPSSGGGCLLERARRPNSHSESSIQSKAIKSKKSKKTQISPLSTGCATNSRAGSEAFNRDGQDEDHVDSRSTSGSSRSKPGSRDITPMTHFSVDGGLDVRMSDREKRKIEQQERFFEQLEHNEQHGAKRRKRNSAGSTLNTPGIMTSKRLGHPESSPSIMSAALKLRGSEAVISRKIINTNSHRATGALGRTNCHVSNQSPRPRLEYVDKSTQTEPKDASSTSLPIRTKPPKPPLSFKRKLVIEAREERLLREQKRSVKTEVQSPALQDVAESKPWNASESAYKDISTMATAECQADSSAALSPDQPAPEKDVEMKEADDPAISIPTISSPKPTRSPSAPPAENPSQASHPPIQPPPPPWPPSSTSPTLTTPQPAQKPVGLFVQLPPTPDFSTKPPSTPSGMGTPGSVNSAITSGSIAHSPTTLNPNPALFSPSVTSAVNSGPARKKLSLSDYTSRRAKKNTETHSVTLPNSTSAISPHAQSVLTATGQDSYASNNTHSSNSPPEASPPTKAADTQSIARESSPAPASTNEEAKPHPPPPVFPAPG